jgi:CMP-N,N'-diacetyllegionaminic acid synthase
MSKNLKVLAIIPARGGSKGLKKKNLRKILGRPLLYYPIKSAIKSGVCDDVFVSTDSYEIAKQAISFGAEVPFLRKKNYSGDLVTTEKTLQNALLEYEKYKNIKYDICVFLTCTNIFRKHSFITKAVTNLINNPKTQSSFVVKKIYKHFWHYSGDKLKKVLPWMKEYTSRQVAPKLFREDTGIALASRSYLWRKGKRIGSSVELIENDFPFSEIDIHDKDDLELASNAMKLLKKQKKISQIY